MVKLNKIYTRTGDDGSTGLVGGERVAKQSLRVEAYGDVDEANACIGVVRAEIAGNAKYKNFDVMLERIQHDLFDLGADFATPENNSSETALRILPAQVLRLEQEMDLMNENIPALNSFVLPGGSKASADLHVARTVTRRAERVACALAETQKINPHAIQYLNRLSDHLFVMARALNDNGAADVLWEPGVNR